MTTRAVLLSSLLEAPGFNPRGDYGQADGSFAELVESIRTHGVLQPPLVRSNQDGTRYTLIGGHRRARAARELGLSEISVSVLPYAPEADNLPLALIENLHRKDLDPMEKAKGFFRMVESGLSMREVARVLGINHVQVRDHLALLDLPAAAQALVSDRRLSQQAGLSIARGVRDGLGKGQAVSIAKQAIKENLTAYEVRERVSQFAGDPMPASLPPAEIILAVPASQKELVQWAIRQYGSLGGALEALQNFHGGGAGKPADSSSVPIASSAVMGSWRDPMGVVRAALRRKWPTILVGFNGVTGALIALPSGPLSSGFVLVCTVSITQHGVYVAHVPMTASGRGRTIGEGIKEHLKGASHA